MDFKEQHIRHYPHDVICQKHDSKGTFTLDTLRLIPNLYIRDYAKAGVKLHLHPVTEKLVAKIIGINTRRYGVYISHDNTDQYMYIDYYRLGKPQMRQALTLQQYMQLFDQHLDLFNLIPNGLAIKI